ncbi:MAG: hypothetical protein JXA20_09240 [Spirochaetes bacterium]|nr:hypothetical protein [Spirochaetota bacterium]
MRILAWFIKHTVIALFSFVMNWWYRLRLGSGLIARRCSELQGRIEALSSREEAARFVKGLLTYRDDPLRGYLDWTCDPVLLYARSREGPMEDSCDCDDFSSLLGYVLKAMRLYRKVECRSVLSRRPFLSQGHSFVIGVAGQGGIDVFSPYAFIATVNREEEIVPLLERHFGDVEFFRFMV